MLEQKCCVTKQIYISTISSWGGGPRNYQEKGRRWVLSNTVMPHERMANIEIDKKPILHLDPITLVKLTISCIHIACYFSQACIHYFSLYFEGSLVSKTMTFDARKTSRKILDPLSTAKKLVYP